MTGLTTPHPTVEKRVKRARPRRQVAKSAEALPAPGAAEIHPVPEIEDVLAECRDAGLLVDAAPRGPLWGWVSCATGARSMTVRADPPDAAWHASALRVFLNGHHTHQPRWKRGAR